MVEGRGYGDSVPRFPRLADHVRARQYIRDGVPRIVLHAANAGEVVSLERETWIVLQCADGTRTLEGITLAATRAGVRAKASAVEQLFRALDEHGLLAEGPPAYGTKPELPPRRSPPERAVVALPEVTWRCDGRGACCSLFASVLWTPEEVMQAHVAWPEFSIGALAIDEVFLPDRGSAPHPLLVSSTVDGACCFLAPDGRCGLHARAGAGSKPWGCRIYPLRLVDDGVEVRASLVTECACTLRLPVEGGEPVLAPDIARVADLPPRPGIDMLPEDVPWTMETSVPRAALRDWIRARWDEPWPDDLAAWLWQLAATSSESPALSDDALALSEELLARCAREVAWRSRDEPVLAAMQWIAGAALELVQREPPAAADAHERAVEHRYLRAAWWGYVDAGAKPWDAWLRDRALRMWAARTMRSRRPAVLQGPAYDEPLAVVDGIMRSRGLGRTAPSGTA